MSLDPILSRVLKRSKEAFEAGDYVVARQMLRKIEYKIAKTSIEYAELCSLWATVEYKLGNNSEALDRLERVPTNRRDAIYWASAAEIYRGNKRLKDAENAILAALRLDRNSFDVQMATAAVWHDCKHFLDAERASVRALELRPTNHQAWTNYGNTLYSLGKVQPSIRAYCNAIEFRPDYVNAYVGRAQLYFREGDFDLALKDYMEALRREPRNAQANFGMSLVALTHGEYTKGFELYEWRWRADDSEKKMPWPMLPREKSLKTRMMLLGEQGYGDNIMMLRYLPYLFSSGYDVTINCLSSLHRLILNNWKDVKITDGNDIVIADYDVCCHAMSLPHIYATTAERVPWHGPYIKSDEPRSIIRTQPPLVGYVWHGNPDQGDDRRRSIPEIQFRQIMQGLENDFAFTSMQWGEPYSPVDWWATCQTIDDMDLLITVDTGIAHLAGAMGLRVWVLLSEPCYWPYMMEGDTTPWYPTMKLFRQQQKGNWSTVIAEVRQELERLK